MLVTLFTLNGSIQSKFLPLSSSKPRHIPILKLFIMYINTTLHYHVCPYKGIPTIILFEGTPAARYPVTKKPKIIINKLLHYVLTCIIKTPLGNSCDWWSVQGRIRSSDFRICNIRYCIIIRHYMPIVNIL